MSAATKTVAALAALTLPHIYSPVPTTTADSDSNKLPEGVTLKLYSKETTSTAGQVTYAPTDTASNDGNGDTHELPKQYSSLSSRAPNEITRTTAAIWTASSSQISASASASLSGPRQTSKQLSSGQISGAVIGSVLGALLLAYIFYVLCWGRRRALQRARQEKRLREERGHRSRMENEQQRSFTDEYNYDHITEMSEDLHSNNYSISVGHKEEGRGHTINGSPQFFDAETPYSVERQQYWINRTSKEIPYGQRKEISEPYDYYNVNTRRSLSPAAAEAANPYPQGQQQQQQQHQLIGQIEV